MHRSVVSLSLIVAACSSASGGGGARDGASGAPDAGHAGKADAKRGDASAPRADATRRDARVVDSAADGGRADGAASVSYTLRFVEGSAYLLYASVGGGTPHQVQLDTGSDGLYVPASVVGASAQVSSTETCSITYISSGSSLSGHSATGPVTLLGSTTTGDVPAPPTTVPMTFCAVDDASWTGGMMGVGFGRTASGPASNVLLQVQDIAAGRMRAGYVLSTHPSPNVQIGVTSSRSAGFQTVPLSASTTGNGDWDADSLEGCVALPGVAAFKQECGGLLVDTGVAETILWGPTDPTLGGLVASGQTSAPAGTAFDITTEAGPMLSFSFVLGSGADTPSAVDIKSASAFSVNTGRALLVDYDYLFDAEAGLVGFQRM
jgi:hypothetical protein